MSSFVQTRPRDSRGKFIALLAPSGFDKKEYRRKRYLSKKEEILAKTKEWAARNPEKRKKIKDRWRAKNKERTNYLTRQYLYRRKNAQGSLSFEEERYLKGQFSRCPYCNVNKPTTIDHVIPLSKGGTNDLGNLLYVCVSCNSKKRAKLLAEWNPLLFVQINRLRA